MNNTKSCSCGKRKSEHRPACRRCCDDYLAGGSPTVFVPTHDGILVPEEATVEWQRAILRGLVRNAFVAV